MSMQRISTLIFGFIGTALVFSPSAQAASFKSNVTHSLQGADAAKGDIFLNSITQNNTTFNNFSFVNRADIIYNTPISNVKAKDTSTPGPNNNNTGAASTDRGDKANSAIAVSGMKNPTGSEIATFLGNNNLNNIIDTEDTGAFKINLFFDSVIQSDKTGLDNLFLWERGMNSNLGIQAIDSAGKVIGNFLKLASSQQTDAGYSIDTTEIDGTQKVGSWGVSLAQLGVTSLSGIQVIAMSTANGDKENYNGPDFKVIARRNKAKVPEPGNLAALGLVAAFVINKRRRLKQIAR